MIFHYLAAATIAGAFVWHFAAGGRPQMLRRLAADRAVGRNSLSNGAHNAIYIALLGFLAGSMVLLLLPSVASAIEMALGVVFLLFSVLDFSMERGKQLAGYFAAIVGALILAGNLT